MADRKTVKLILVIIVLIVLVIALATKAAHWDKVYYKGAAQDQLPQMYPGLVGCIAVDSILIFAFIVAVVFHFNGNLNQYAKYLVLFVAIMLLIRLVLSLLFLAGDNQYVQNMIDYCNNNNNNNYWNYWCGDSFFQSLKGAWIWEIITIIVVNILAVGALYLIYKEGTS